MVWDVSLSPMKLIPHRLTAQLFTRYSEFDKVRYSGVNPSLFSALPPDSNVERYT